MIPQCQCMKAIVYRGFGSPEILRYEEIAKSAPADDEVLVRVGAASVNPLDWRLMRGGPPITRMLFSLGTPKIKQPGKDVAGEVEAVGKNVTQFKPGDEVFGLCRGAFAAYACAPESRLVLKPAQVSFEQAASIPVAGLTALQGLRDKGQLRPGQKVLVNGASGGVGTFAVQLAKYLGAHVTAVCSTRNLDMVRSLGADEVIDYTRTDFTKSGQRYDLILDCVGNHSAWACRRALKPEGRCAIAGAPKELRKILARMFQALLLSRFVRQKFVMYVAKMSHQDLNLIADLIASGRVTAVIDRRYSLNDVPAAIAYLEQGHARGKVIITFENRAARRSATRDDVATPRRGSNMGIQSNLTADQPLEPQARAGIAPWQRFFWSLRRELWEHRAIYFAPLGAAVLFVIGFLITTVHLPEQIRAARALVPTYLSHHVEEPYELASALVMGVALLVALFYSLDCLQSERRDRSILFWKSLPVSDFTAVLAKACIPVLVVPLVAFAVTVATQLLMVLISAPILAASGVSLAAMWSQHSLLRSWWLLLYHLITVHGLWWAPFYGWLLLVSAWARRGSFLWTASWAIVPPFAVGYFEYLVFHTSHFARMLEERFSGAGMEAVAVPGTMPWSPMTQLTPFRFLTSAGLWIGLALFTVFLAGAVRLRRQRGPV